MSDICDIIKQDMEIAFARAEERTFISTDVRCLHYNWSRTYMRIHLQDRCVTCKDKVKCALR